MVTIYTTSLTLSNTTFCPHTVFLCFVWISEQTAIISLYNINWLVFITETQCVYCAVRTGCLYTIQFNFNLNSSSIWPGLLCFSLSVGNIKAAGQVSFLDLSIVNIFRFRSDITIFIVHKYRMFLFILFPSMTILLHRKPDSLSYPVTRVKITCTTKQTSLNNVDTDGR